MKKLNKIIANPSGNITAFVMNKTKRKNQKDIANAIMFKDKRIEQVGFFEKSDKFGAVAKLQMMGGEFCGNASRAFASILYNNGIVKNETFYISVSGVKNLINCKIKKINENDFYSKVLIKTINGSNKITEQYIAKDKVPCNVVEMEGISHILVNENQYGFDKENYLKKANYIIDILGMRDRKAVGIIWYKQNAGKLEIKPVVWVKDTNSYYYESACGSGSLALGLFLSKNKDINTDYKIYQPSGDFIDIGIEKKNKTISIGGNVKIF